MNPSQLIATAIEKLAPTFAQIDQQIKHNLHKVLNAFQEYKVGVHHFSSVSGYGHDDLGREVLDQVFARVVGANSSAVRVQIVSGTHAIASCLYGVLRPADEMLAVAGHPYDTLEEVIGIREKGKEALGNWASSIVN